MPTNPFDYIQQEITRFKTERIHIADNWDWNMHEHIQRTIMVKHGKFTTGANDGNRPYKNIVKPILNVAYRTEGFDVKDITPYVNDEKNYYKSFFVKKFHPRWAKLNDIDTFIDELSESTIDFGLGLAKNVHSKRPECVPLQRIAFCNQKDVLSGPICEVHPYSVADLEAMKGKWDATRIDEAITFSQSEEHGKPGQDIEVYELHGILPANWLDGDEYENSDEWVSQLHIVVYYNVTKNGPKQGISLFKGRERKEIYKAHKRDPIYGRACGFGGAEELFEPQVWTNYAEIQIKEMLDVASMMIMQTADDSFAGKNVTLGDLQKGEIVVHEEGKPVSQVGLTPYNKQAFDNAVEKWEQHAMTMGSASEGALGKNPSSGTPFALQNLIVQEGNGMHDYRRGKLAVFVGNKIYPDWILPAMVKDMLKGQKWVDELSVEEMQEITDTVVTNLANDKIKQKMLGGELPTPEEMLMFKEVTKAQFMKSGSKRFLEIVEGELKDIPIDVEVNVAGKQKNMVEVVDKLTNIFRQIFANPAVLQMPGMGKLFNEIIESAGLSPLDFSSFTKQQLPQPVAPVPEAEESEEALIT